MPWTAVSPDRDLKHLSILDENGNVDENLMPPLQDDDLLVRGYRTMLTARRFDEQRLKLQRSGRIGTFAPVNGQEAAQIGTIAALRDDDWLVPSYRETAASIWRGTELADMLVFDAGYNEGTDIPEEARNLPISVPVGTQMLQAAGIGYAARLAGSDEVVMTYFGDGATSQGDFHEAMNFASVFDCPVIFVCQNNQYAISVPRARQTRSETIAQKAVAYGMGGVQVDGNDVLACHVAAAEAVTRARQEYRPTLIECVTYRQEMHTTADDPTRYREDSEVDEWMKRDPITRFQAFLKNRGTLDDDALKKIENEVSEAVDAAWPQAEERFEELRAVGPIFAHVFAEMPNELKRQRDRMSEGGSPGVANHE